MASQENPIAGRAKTAWLPWAGVVLSAALLAAGLWIFARNECRTAIAAWEGRLSAMADDRELALETYIEERRGDAQVIAAYPTVRALLAGGDSHGGNGEGDTHRVHLEAILANIVREYHYTAAFVLDSNGVILAQAGEGSLWDRTCQAARDRFLASGKPWEIDIHRGEGGHPHLTVRAAVFAKEGPSPGGAEAHRTLGAVVLVQDPGQWLYPLLRRESVPTRTAESLVAHREGQEIVFLSPVRHRDIPPLTFRVPLENSHLAARTAILGTEGFGEFVDYRGQPIFAATRRVRGTDWGLVVKVDRSEALQEAHREAALTATAGLAFLLALWGAAFALLRSRRLAHLREVARLEREGRVRAEGDAARVAQLNRLLTTLSEVNQMVVREKDRGRLLGEVCRILVEHGKFRMAWVGFKEEGTGRVRPAAWAGHDEGYLGATAHRYDDTPDGRGPTGTAIREGRHVVNLDFAEDPSLALWRVEALARGYRSSATFPLRLDGEVAGALTVYAGEPGAFGQGDIDLLHELAGDIGFALQALEDSEGRAKAVESLRQSELRYRRLFESAKDGILILDWETGGIVDANPFLSTLLGYSREELLGKKLWEIGFLQDVVQSEEAFSQLKEKEYIRYEDLPLEAKSGQRMAVEFVSNVYLVGSQKVIQCNIRDITDRKQAENELKARNEELERFNRLTVGRELRMIELKREVNEMAVQTGGPAPYPNAGGAGDESLAPSQEEKP